MIRLKTTKSKVGRSYRFTIFGLFTVETGVHDVNGIHANLGLGVGPCEISLTLHNWDKW